MGGQILEYEAKTILNQGKQEGLEEGIEKGIEKGIDSFANLTSKLLQANRLEDLKRASEDIEYRKQLYQELDIRISK